MAPLKLLFDTHKFKLIKVMANNFVEGDESSQVFWQIKT